MDEILQEAMNDALLEQMIIDAHEYSLEEGNKSPCMRPSWRDCASSSGRRWKRPVCLDLFCGAGGAAWGYALAGFEVIGVDCRPQPRYPFRFLLGDALTWLEQVQDQVDLIHASPPCQRWSPRTPDRTRHPDWVHPTLARLQALDKPFVLENVPGAHPVLRSALLLCGSMFGLPLRRHRLFQSNLLLFAPGPCHHEVCRYGVYGHSVWVLQRQRQREERATTSVAQGRRAMGLPWMSQAELAQAIPPHYTWWLGWQVRAVLEGGRCPNLAPDLASLVTDRPGFPDPGRADQGGAS